MRLAVVCNPAAVEDPEGLRAEIKRREASRELIWLETTVADPGAGQTREALAAGAELVFVCGGDGTVAACLGALAGTGVPAALIPSGTGNLLARNLDLPLDLPSAVDRAFGAQRRTIDLLESNGHCFAVMSGLGFDAALIRDTGETAKKRHGWAAYLVGGVRALRRTPRVRYEVRVDDGPPRSVLGLGVIVGNIGELEAGMAVLPDADPTDGLLDVIVLSPRGWAGLLALAARIVLRRPDNGTQAEITQGRRVEIRADRAVPVEFDGDYAGEQDSMTVTVLPGAVTICGAS